MSFCHFAQDRHFHPKWSKVSMINNKKKSEVIYGNVNTLRDNNYEKGY